MEGVRDRHRQSRRRLLTLASDWRTVKTAAGETKGNKQVNRNSSRSSSNNNDNNKDEDNNNVATVG